MIEFTPNVIRYDGNNSTTSFDYPFRIFSTDDLLVYVGGSLQTYPTHYNVTGVDLDEGGSVDFVTAPSSGNSNVVIERSVPYTQTIAIPEGSKFPVHLVETGMDRIVVMIQQLLDADARSLSIASYATTGLEDFTLSEDADDRAGRVLAFTDDGLGMTVGPTVAELESLLDATALLEVPASTLRGRGSDDGTGPVENLTLGDGLSLDGVVLSASPGFPSVDSHSRVEGHTIGLNIEAGHPVDRNNPDTAKLRACQYLVTDKGTIVTPRLNLTADFATVGAGGRDRADDGTTGHRWWKIYHIFKDTDDPTDPAEDALLFSPAHVRQQTAAFINTADSAHTLRINSGTEMASQSFTTTFAVSELHEVILAIARVNAPSGNVWVEIHADASGSPSGTALATSVKKQAGRLLGAYAFNPFVFVGDQRISLADATVYHIVLKGDFTIDGSNYVIWGRVTAGGYSGGTALLYNGSSWSGVGADARFSVIGLPAAPSVTMPSGYTDKCFLGYTQTIANGAEFVACSGRDREYIDRSVASSAPRLMANPVNTTGIWFSTGHGITASTLGSIPYKPTMVLTARAYGSAAALNFGVGGEDAPDIPGAIPTTYIEDTEYYSSAGSTIPTPVMEIPVGRAGGAHLTVSAGSGSVIYRTGFRW